MLVSPKQKCRIDAKPIYGTLASSNAAMSQVSIVSVHVACSAKNCWPPLLGGALRSLFYSLDVSLFLPVFKDFLLLQCISNISWKLWVSKDFLSVSSRIEGSRFVVKLSRNLSAMLCFHKYARPVTSLGHYGRIVFSERPKFFKQCRSFKLCQTHFPGKWNIFQGRAKPPFAPSFGPGNKSPQRWSNRIISQDVLLGNRLHVQLFALLQYLSKFLS